jgi:hypothetical protein
MINTFIISVMTGIIIVSMIYGYCASERILDLERTNRTIVNDYNNAYQTLQKIQCKPRPYYDLT